MRMVAVCWMMNVLYCFTCLSWVAVINGYDLLEPLRRIDTQAGKEEKTHSVDYIQQENFPQRQAPPSQEENHTNPILSEGRTLTARLRHNVEAEDKSASNTQKNSSALALDREAANVTDEDNIEPCVEQELLSRYNAPLYRCQNAASFYRWINESSMLGRVAVSVAKVNGGLSLLSAPNLTLVALLLPHSNLTHLTNHNQNLSSLEELDLSGNPEFEASSLQPLAMLQEALSLQQLDVSFTGLRHLAHDTFHHQQNLQSLNIAGNEFITLTLEEDLVQQLVYLNMSGCQLREIQIKAKEVKNIPLASVPPPARLRTLDVSHNLLTFLPNTLINLLSNQDLLLNITDNLWNETCTHCSLYHLWKFATANPQLIQGVEALDCFQMEKAMRSCDWEQCPHRCSCDRRNKIVDCRGTGMEKIPFYGPADAETLLMEDNSLSDMSGIESPVWCKLKNVDLTQNNMTAIISSGITGHCTCTDNDYYWDERNCFPQMLKKIVLNHNKIKTLSSDDCKVLYPLQELRLNGNEVQLLGAQACGFLQKLEVLSMNENMLSNLRELDFATYPNLQELYISHNMLVTLPHHITELMPKLKVLDVSHNFLEEFTSKSSSPDSPFTSMVSSPLEKLYLNNNNFTLIELVLNLKHIPTLKKLHVSSNPWSCPCGVIRRLSGKVFHDLRHSAMIKAVQTMKCHSPAELSGLNINNPHASKACSTMNSGGGDLFFPVVAMLIVFIVIVFILCKLWQRISQSLLVFLREPSFDRNDETFRRRYSVFVVHSSQDYEMVKKDVVTPLTAAGYTVAWHGNAFLPGEQILACIQRAVSNSRRMIVVVTRNFTSSQWGQQELMLGLNEERNTPGFKVLALVVGSLPPVLSHELCDIVVRRIHVQRSSRDYISRIRTFLPAQRLFSSSWTETNIDIFLRKQLERRQRIRAPQAHVEELFNNQEESNHIHHGGVDNMAYASSEGEAIAPAVNDDNDSHRVSVESEGRMVARETRREPFQLEEAAEEEVIISAMDEKACYSK